MKVLIVEDDLALSDVLAFTLRHAGFEVALAYKGADALAQWQAGGIDLVLLDLNLPGMDGLAVCRAIRAQAQTPIIMLTVRSSESDVVQGLELGADDYMVKPFSPRELLARIGAVMRRAGLALTPGVLQVGRLILDRSRREVRREGGEAVRLTPLETTLLETLMLHPGQVLPADTLVTAVWGNEGGDRAMLKQLVYRLRSKVEADPGQPRLVETVTGVGYGFVQEHT